MNSEMVADVDSGTGEDTPLPATSAALAAAALLAACGGGGGAEEAEQAAAATRESALSAKVTGSAALSAIDASRFLTQATFGIRAPEDVTTLKAQGLDSWLAAQFGTPSAQSCVAYLDSWAARKGRSGVTTGIAYEAIWQQWLFGADQLRSRAVWALMQLFVVSNVADDLRTYAMASYVDMLSRNAFGNYRQLLEEVTLHPTMGYYLNMLRSQPEDTALGTHPSENYAREVMQLFSIGLVKLNLDGTPQMADGVPLATYDQSVVRGFSKAFTGWSFGSRDNTDPKKFFKPKDTDDANWLVPMKAWPTYHDSTAKAYLDGWGSPAGQTPEQDLKDALDNIFYHPNVGPFFGRQMIQRLVTSNPSPAYVARVASAFNDNGAGVRGDLQAVWRAILLDPEARGDDAPSRAGFGKQREPVVRFANFLHALGATSGDAYNPVSSLDSADKGLGQSPMLAPSVFNFYSPSYRPAGALADAGLSAPEFQITGENTVAGSMNFFASLFDAGTYGAGSSMLTLNYAPLLSRAGDPVALLTRLDALFFNRQMSEATRARLTSLLAAMANYAARDRVVAALKLVAMSPDFVIQK